MDKARHQIETSGSSSSSRGGGVSYGRIKSSCGRDAVVRSVKNGPNVGLKFHGCPLWPDTCCGFFKWIGVRDEVDDLRFQLFEKETTITELEMHKQMLEDKVKRVQLKKENLEEDVQELKGEVSQMRIELMKSARNERNFSLALVLSWVLFGIVIMAFK
uniref:GRF-type domain-containing protein n=1 Tax=Chenopodium quinoa TaxID=63459 RepID=A0A803LVE6_CHEQI